MGLFLIKNIFCILLGIWLDFAHSHWIASRSCGITCIHLRKVVNVDVMQNGDFCRNLHNKIWWRRRPIWITWCYQVSQANYGRHKRLSIWAFIYFVMIHLDFVATRKGTVNWTELNVIHKKLPVSWRKKITCLQCKFDQSELIFYGKKRVQQNPKKFKFFMQISPTISICNF